MSGRRGIKAGALVENLRSSLWFLPSLMVVAAIALALWLNRIDAQEGSLVETVAFPGGAEGARAILQAVAGSVITVTGVVFSLTVVTLQLASAQFSPRLLRTFLRDVRNQIVLGTFLATFAFALVTLRGVRSGPQGGDDVVPALGVLVSYVLAAASIAALVFFIDHIARSVRVDTLMQEVEKDTLAVIDAVHPEPYGAGERPDCLPDPPGQAVVVPAARSGFVTAIGSDALLDTAMEHGIVLRVAPAVGERVVADAPLAWAWPAPSTRSARRDDDVKAAVNEAVRVGSERTMQQDVGYGLRQLVDIAVKALSPGVNDPTTAVHAIAHLAAILAVLARRDLGPVVRRDDDGAVRVGLPTVDLAAHLDLVCGQIRRYGAHEPIVIAELLHLLRDIVRCDGAGPHLVAVRDEANRLLAAAEREIHERHDLETLRAIVGDLDSALADAAGGRS